MIVHKHNLVFIHASKTAGTSVENSLLPLTLADHPVGEGWGNLPPATKSKLAVGNNRQHHTVSFILERYPEVRGFDFFGVYRDPLDRAISEFFYQKNNHPNAYKLKAYNDNDVSGAITQGKWEQCAFPAHLKSQREMFYSPHKDINIFPMSKLDQVEKFLLKKTGICVDIPHDNISVGKKEVELSEEAKHVVWDIWGEDYDFLGIDPPEAYKKRIPRVVWMFWEQGWQNSPRVCRASLNSWKANCPHWTVKALDGNSPEVKEASYLWEGKNMSVQHRSDLLRIWLLQKYGGVWADATTLCFNDLSRWIDGSLSSDGFFHFKNQPFANWFLASKPEAPLTVGLLNACVEHLSCRSKPSGYFWQHDLVLPLLQSGLAADMKYISAIAKGQPDGPHFMLGKDSCNPAGAHFLRRIMFENFVPLIKVSHKINYPTNSKAETIIKMFL